MTSLCIAALVLTPTPGTLSSGVSIRQFRLAVNVAQSFAETAYPSLTESEIQIDIRNAINQLNHDTLVPYAGSRLEPSIDRIRIWDSRFNYNAFAGQEYRSRRFTNSITP